MERMTMTPRTLAIGCACYMKGWAVLDFPGSTKASPSQEVWVQRSIATPKQLPVAEGVFEFPMIVRWDVWRQVVVPILTTVTMPGSGSFSSLVETLETELMVALKEEGFLPE